MEESIGVDNGFNRIKFNLANLKPHDTLPSKQTVTLAPHLGGLKAVLTLFVRNYIGKGLGITEGVALARGGRLTWNSVDRGCPAHGVKGESGAKRQRKRQKREIKRNKEK